MRRFPVPNANIAILVASGLLMLGVLASHVSGRLGVPALLFFMAIGMLTGAESPVGIIFNNLYYAQLLGVAALTLILFDGGMKTSWHNIRPVFWKGLSLSTIGVFLTTVLVGVFARATLGFSWLEGMLLGAVVSSTDAAAVFSILRSHKSALKGQANSLLEFESGSNDPMAVFLTVSLIELIQKPQTSIWHMIPFFFLQMGLGALIGYLGPRVLIATINRLSLEFEGLYPVMSLAFVLLLYSGTSALGGSGFLAAYIAGLVLGNREFLRKRAVVRFHDGLAWIMQIAMFLTLGLLVYPSHLIPVIAQGTMLSLFLIFFARPIAVFISLFRSSMPRAEKAMVTWVGLKGAAPIILAVFPLLAGIPQASLMFNLVFFIVLVSAVLQGTPVPLVARLLNVLAPMPEKHKIPIKFEPEEKTDMELRELAVPKGSIAEGKKVVELGLPKTALIILVTREREFIVPRGDTFIRSGDILLVLASRDDFYLVRSTIEAL